MKAGALPLLGVLAAGLAWAFSKEEETQAKPPKEPRPGQPSPGAGSPIPGVPSIPSPPTAGQEPQVPPHVLARMVAAIGSGSSAEMRRVADALEREGFTRQASELRAAADALDASLGAIPPGIPVVSTPPPGAVPVSPPKPGKPRPVVPPFVPPEVSKPPPIFTTQPVPSPALPPGVPILVPKPPPGAVPIERPPTPEFPPGAIPDTATLVGKTALMLWESAPSGPVRNVPLLTEYKKKVGLKDAGNLYGAGTAKSLMVREIIGPTPWDWPSDPTRRKDLAKDLIGNYKFKARKDPARAEEWLRAAADVERFAR